MADTKELQNSRSSYEIDTKLDKIGEINFNPFENRYSVKFSNFPNLVTNNDLRYLDNEFIVGIRLPELNISTLNNKRNGRNNIIPLANRENEYKTTMTFKIDENLYNYFIIRDYIMALQEGNITKELTDDEFYSSYKIDYIQIDYLDNSANPKVTRSSFLHNVFIVGITGIDIDEVKKRIKFNCDIVFEREGKKVYYKA